ncbi:MAG TPA: hypothetical protein VMU36_13805 [Spirochaetia bacterium]|nr:hypothetical protein [Spirochaetia bacterium]
MKTKAFSAVLVSLLLFSCTTTMNIGVEPANPAPNAPPTPPGSEIRVLQSRETLPEGAILVARLKLRDTGLTVDCGFQAVVARAKEKARELGGKLLRLVRVYPPGWSTCYELDAEVYALPE